jgi:hypothetical protein
MCAFHKLRSNEASSASDSITGERLAPLVVDNLEHDHRSNAEKDNKCKQDVSTRPSEVIMIPEVILHLLTHRRVSVQVPCRAPWIFYTNHMGLIPKRKISCHATLLESTSGKISSRNSIRVMWSGWQQRMASIKKVQVKFSRQSTVAHRISLLHQDLEIRHQDTEGLHRDQMHLKNRRSKRSGWNKQGAGLLR